MTMMPQTSIPNRLLNKTPLAAGDSMDLWVKASTATSTQIAIDFIGNLPGVNSVYIAKPASKPVMPQAMLRIKYCSQHTCSAQIAQ